jgi:hypothetical protein
MSENWKQWQGRTVGGDLQLSEHLGGSETTATYVAAGPGDTKVAVKLVVADAATADARLSKWKTGESLSHPHLLRILRSGSCEFDGSKYLFVAMEFAEENLSQIIPQRALTPEEVREMLPPILEALDYLHSNHLVHASLTPGNIMAAADQLKLSSDRLLRNGEAVKVVGPYDAPEATRGVSPASDIWALGVTLTEVLTQRRPTWETGSTLAQLPHNLPEQFRVMVQRCLLQDPALRGTTSDIRERLRSPVPKPSQVTTTPAVPPKRASSSKRIAIPAGIAAVVIGALVAIPRFMEHPPQPEKAAVTEPAKPSQVPASPAPSLLTEATDPKPAPEKFTEPTKRERIELLVGQKATEAPKVSVVPPPKADVARAITADNHEGVVNQVLPDVPRKALHTISGRFHVNVKVQVDRAGNVVDSEFVSRGPSKYFADLTMQAAREWKFTPADVNSRAWNLQFEFKRSGINAVPTQLSR